MTDLSLDPPQLPALPPARLGELEAKGAAYVRELAHAPDMGELERRVAALARIGADEIRAAADATARLGARGRSGEAVGVDLDRLRALADALDPARAQALLDPPKRFGLFPQAARPADFFRRYAEAEDEIADLLARFARTRDELACDDIALSGDERRLLQAAERLDEAAHLLRTLEGRLEAAARELGPSDPERSRLLRERATALVRERQADVVTQAAVTMQGRLALAVVRQNNAELARGLDRATTTTVAALRVASAVAQALTGQRLVLARIATVDAATTRLGEAAEAGSQAQLGALGDAFARLDEAIGSIEAVRRDAAERQRRDRSPAANR